MDYFTRRNDDMRRARDLEEKLNEIYVANGLDICRVSEKGLQIRGVDLIAQGWSKSPMIVDEKAAIQYWDKDLKTFAFELLAMNNPLHYGWLYNPTSLTTHYMLIWVRGTSPEIADIHHVEIMCIPKTCIVTYLKGIWEKHQNAMILLENNTKDTSGTVSYALNDDVRLVKSYQLVPEQPLNVVISKTVLEKIAIKHICYDSKDADGKSA